MQETFGKQPYIFLTKKKQPYIMSIFGQRQKN